GVEIALEAPTCRQMVDQLDRRKLHQPVLGGIEAGGLGIDDDLARHSWSLRRLGFAVDSHYGSGRWRGASTAGTFSRLRRRGPVVRRAQTPSMTFVGGGKPCSWKRSN